MDNFGHKYSPPVDNHFVGLTKMVLLWFNIGMKDYLKGVATQATAILLAAAGAAAFAFFQSMAASYGVCPAPAVDPVEVGGLGALFKSIHTALTMNYGILRA